jgi:hypothetical protein
MDITLQPTDVYQAEDRSWLGSSDGTDHTQTVTLATATFTPSTHYPNGYIPSGVVLGQITASGATQWMYGPYDDTATDGRQKAIGFLYSNQKVRSGGPNVGAPIHWRGVVKSARLPIVSTSPGGLDAAGKTDLAAKFWIQ